MGCTNAKPSQQAGNKAVSKPAKSQSQAGGLNDTRRSKGGANHVDPSLESTRRSAHNLNALTVPGSARGGRDKFKLNDSDVKMISLSLSEVIGIDQQGPNPRFCGTTNLDYSIQISEPMIDDVSVPLASSCTPLSTAQIELAIKLGMDPRNEVHLSYIIKQFASLPPPLGWERIKTRRDEFMYRKISERTEREFDASENHPLFSHYRHVLHDLRDHHLDMSGAKSPLGKRPVDFVTFSKPARWNVSAGKEGILKNSIDHNELFQKSWEQLSLQPSSMSERERTLQNIISDFEKEALEAAVDYIQESYHTARNGHVRRGNLLLQYQNSETNIGFYGSRELAGKMCRHESNGFACIRSGNIMQLHAPLHCTVCYLGNRVDVVAAVPIDTKHGLILGPQDRDAPANKREYISNVGIEGIMNIISCDLRLRQHRSASMSLIKSGSATTEAFHGNDGRHYVTQASRLLPMLPALQIDSRLFRPELVNSYRRNINPNTYSKMDQDDIREDLHKYLHEEVLLKFCSWFVCEEAMQLLIDGKEKTSEVFHHFGIPMRSLKDACDTLIRYHSESPFVVHRVDQLCMEMVARSLKVLLRNTSNSTEIFQDFLDQPIEYVAPLCLKKYNWDPIQDSMGFTIKDPEKILEILSKMIDSRISRSVDDSTATFALSIELNETVLHAKPKHHVNSHVYTFACGYQRFRPELLRKIRRDQLSVKGLNSDGLSSESLEGDLTEDISLTDTLVVESLMKDVVPQFASNLLRKPPLDGDHLSESLHSKGINLRYLGTVLGHLMEWSDDGDWRTVRDKTTNVPVAVEAVISEMFARTFSAYLNDHMHGHNYAESTMIAKAAVQAVIDNPSFLCKKIYSKFGGPKKYTLPPAEKVIKRISEICGATIVLATDSRVAEVELKPVMKGVELPSHTKCSWLDTDEDGIDISEFPAMENVLQDYIEGRRTPPETALPMLALLSLIYQRWESQSSGIRQKELLECRNQMIQLTDPSSVAHADANILLGSYFRSLKELRQAANYYYRSYSILQKKLEAGESVEGTANVVFIEIDSTMAEYYQQEGKFEEAISHYTRAIEKTEQELGSEDESLGRLLEQRARTACTLCRYEESARDFERALEIVKTSHGVDAPEIADIAICLGQIHSHKGRLDLCRKSFESAYSIFRDSYGKHSDSAVMVLTEMLAPCYKKLNIMSQYHKCTLEQLTMEHTDASEEVAKKYFEIAVAYEHEQKQEQAVKYFQLALISHRKAYGPDHKYTLKCEEWLSVLGGKDPANVPLMQPRTSPRLVLGSSGQIAVPKLALQKTQEESIGEAPKLKPNLSSRGGMGLSARNMQGAWNSKAVSQQPRPLSVQHLNSSVPPPSHAQLSQHVSLSSTVNLSSNTLNNTVTSSTLNNALASTYGSPPQHYKSRDGDNRESPPPGGSPNFYKQEPRTIGSILRRAGMGELHNIPMAMDESASESSSDWTSDV